MKDFSNEELVKRFNALINKDNWEEECEWCVMPGMLHKGPCTRKEETEYQEVYECWKMYRNRMKPIIESKQKQEEKVDDSGMEKFATVVSEAFTSAQKPLIEAILKRDNRPATIMKAAKPPTWTKNMTLDMYIKAINVWGAQNRGVPEVNKYQDVIESLKQNKEISGLEKYMGEHVYAALDTEEDQTIASLMAMLKRRYGKT